MSNRKSYFFFLITGLFIRIGAGFYLTEVFLIILLFIKIFSHRLRIKAGVKPIFKLLFFLLMTPTLFSIIIENFYLGESITRLSFFIPYNILLLFLYIITIPYLLNTKMNYNIVLLFMSLPLVLSLIGFMYEPFDLFIKTYYKFDKNFVDMNMYYKRYGGVFGNDVNQLGFYSSLMILFTFFLKEKGLINKLMFYFIISISLFLTIQSGMRTGLVLIIPFLLFGVLFGYLKLFSRNEFIVFIAILVFSFFVFNIGKYIDITNISITRFSIDQLETDMFSGKVHASGMYVRWLPRMIIKNHDIISLMFATLPSWKFPDSLILFMLGNNGLIGLSLYFIMILILFRKIFILGVDKNSKFYLIWLLSFSFFSGFKGGYTLNNYGMLIIVIITTLVFVNFEDKNIMTNKIKLR